MKKVVGIAAVAALVLVGCGNYTGDTVHNDNTGQDHSNNSVDYGSGTVLVCTDANCSILGTPEADKKQADGNFTIQEVPDDEPGVYPGPDAPLAECNAAGFFWCSIERKCLNQPLNDASSSCSK